MIVINHVERVITIKLVFHVLKINTLMKINYVFVKKVMYLINKENVLKQVILNDDFKMFNNN